MLTTITSNPKALLTITLATAICVAAALIFAAGRDTVHAGINAHSRGFDLNLAHDSPRGAWSDRTTMWVVDTSGSDSKLLAYRLATGARTSSKDISLTGGNTKPMGIWSDGSVMWVADWDDNKLYAYDLDTRARASDRDISLHRYNTAPRGVGGTTQVIYVVDKDDKHVYAYYLSDGSRYVSAEFDLHGSNDSPWGFTASSSEDVFWVTDLADEMLYRYYYTGFGSTQGGQDFRVPLGNGDPMGLWGNGEVFWMVDDEDDHVYAMIHKDFRHSGDDIDIDDVTDPKGIWTDGDTMWVSYSTASNGALLAYNLSTGARDSAKDFTLASTNDSPVAMWSDGTHIWVSEEDGRTLYAYSLDGSGTYSAVHSRVLPIDNADPTGFWSNGDLTWVADATDDKIYAYDASTFFRSSDHDIDLDTGNSDPGNIWSDGNTIWVFDTADKNAYAYSLRTGNRKRSEEFRPVPDNDNFSGGMTGHGLRFWVVDTDDQQLYAYAKQNTSASFSERSVQFKIHHSLAGGSLIGMAPAATDVDGDSLTYAIRGSDSRRFTIDSQSGEISSKSDTTFIGGERLSFVATVSDGKGLLDGVDLSADDSVNVIVNVTHNANPTFVTEDGTTFTVPEDTAAGGAIAQLDTTDLDNHTLVFGIRRSARFPFRVVAGQVKLNSDATLDFETVASYNLTVRIRDDLNEANEADTEWDDEIAITIQVSNVDEAGAVSLGSNNPEVNVSLTASLTDPDGSVADLTWQWQNAATVDATTWTDISGATASSYTPVSGDAGKFIRALASYDDGQGTDKTAFGVASNSVLADTPTNQSPSFTEGAATSRSIAENAESGALVGAPIVATDPDTDDTLTYRMLSEGSNPFHMDFYTGQISRTAQTFLSYERGASYTATVRVRDGKNADGEDDVAWDAFIDVTINVLDVDEPGMVALTEEHPQVGQQISAELDDPDIPVTNVSWQWQTADTADATTWTDVADATTGDYTPTLADHEKFLRAQATYDDKHGTGKTVHMVSTNAVPPRPANQPPAFDAGATATRSVTEAAVTGARVGSAVLASDAEGDELTYSLASGDDADKFSVNSVTGELQVAGGALLDFETDPSATVTVQVTDGKDSGHNADTTIDDTITVTINLDNADESGKVRLSTSRPQFEEAVSASLTDPDGGITAISWQWSKSDDRGSTWTELTGATSAAYTPVSADEDALLRATASYTDDQGSGKSASMVSSGVVRDPAAVDTSLESLTLAGINFAFNSTTFHYGVSTPNADTLTQVTAVPFATSGVTVAILPADSRPSEDGHQVDLATGNNAITVTVTHDQTGSSTTYRMQVNRPTEVLNIFGQNMNQGCPQGVAGMTTVICGSTSFAKIRTQADGYYTVNWRKWDRKKPDVTAYTVTLEQYMYKTYHRGGRAMNMSALANTYESCEFSDGSWSCTGQARRTYQEHRDGQLTVRRVVIDNADQTELSWSLAATGVTTAQETFYRWSGDAADPDNVPTAVTYQTKTSEVDRYHFVPHGINGDLNTKKVTINGMVFANPFAP